MHIYYFKSKKTLMRAIKAKQLLLTWVPALFILLIAILVNQVYDVRIVSMTRDVTVLGHIHPFSGFVSSLGILLWTVTAAICLFASVIFKKSEQKDLFWFFLSAALLSFYLLFDDLFTLHEHSGIIFKGGEYFIYLVLGIAMLVYLIYFKTTIFKSNYIMLLMALFLFSSSIAVDVIQPYFWKKGDLHALIEDGTKWMGIACWCSYYVHTAYKYLSQFLVPTK